MSSWSRLKPFVCVGLTATSMVLVACNGGSIPADNTAGEPAVTKQAEPTTPQRIDVPKPMPPRWTPVEQKQSIDRLREVRHEDLDEVMKLLAPQPGSKVADIGCGIGYFTLPIARAVGADGVVYATDFDQRLLDVMAEDLKRPENRTIQNIQPMLTESDAVGLEAASVDLAFLAHLDFYAFDVINEHHEKMLKGVFQAIKPGGRLVVLQWMGTDPPNTNAANLSANFKALGFVENKVVAFESFDSCLIEFTRP